MIFIVDTNGENYSECLKSLEEALKKYPKATINTTAKCKYGIAMVSNADLEDLISSYMSTCYNSKDDYQDLSPSNQEYILKRVKDNLIEIMNDDNIYEIIEETFNQLDQEAKDAETDAKLDYYEGYKNRDDYGDDFVRNVS